MSAYSVVRPASPALRLVLAWMLPEATSGSPMVLYCAACATAVAQAAQYNTIRDPLVASGNIHASTSLKAGLAGLTTLYADIAAGTLPSVSFVVPKNLDSGHPGYSVPAK